MPAARDDVAVSQVCRIVKGIDVDGSSSGVGGELCGSEGGFGAVMEPVGGVEGVHGGSVIGLVEPDGDDAFDRESLSSEFMKQVAHIFLQFAMHDNLSAV